MDHKRDPLPNDEPMAEAEAAAGIRWLRFIRLAAVDVGPLRRHRDFRLLSIGQLVSFFGAMVTDVAVAFQVYQLTHSTVLVGLLAGVELVPMLTLGLGGGLFADARDRRRMVLVSEGAFMVISGALLINASLPSASVPLIFVLTAARAGLFAIQRPSLDALLPRLVSPDEIPAATAISTVRGTVGMIAGPAAGGVLISVAGLPFAYGLDMATFALSLAMLRMMREVPPPASADAPSFRRLAEGLRYAWSRQELVGTYVVDIAAMFFGMPMALFPAIAARFGGATVLGLLYAAPAMGSLVVAATSAWTGKVRRHGLGVILAATGWGLAIIAFGFATTPVVALLMLAAAGAADCASGIFRSAIWNQTIPDGLRGRLAGIEFLSYTTGPALGNVEAGLVGGLVGVQAAVVSGGILCVLVVTSIGALLPRMRAYRWDPASGQT
jgi:MFS family permease